MIELVLLGAAAISIAMTASGHNKRRFAPVPARMRKRQTIVSPRPTAN
jgi:hypothetical protein